jgi:hypothetical protein
MMRRDRDAWKKLERITISSVSIAYMPLIDVEEGVVRQSRC